MKYAHMDSTGKRIPPGRKAKQKLQMAMITLNVSTDWNYDVGIMLDTIVIIKIKSRVAAIAAIMSFFFIALLL